MAHLCKLSTENEVVELLKYFVKLDGNKSESPPMMTPYIQKCDAFFLFRLRLFGVLPAPQPVNINEDATNEEETPSAYAWWISRMERLWNAPLYDSFANLLTNYHGNPTGTSNTNYMGDAGFRPYRYYAASMVGERGQTIGSTNRQWDCSTTIDSESGLVRIPARSRAVACHGSDNIFGRIWSPAVSRYPVSTNC
ncbi:hypothetical protein B0T10DRAFT_467349 [Thelonectria olida]|uniref:Uncharacterized protein n=1 Tax=Thelonectria olida TaxID=1576542 RepID=A0A9P8VRT7_9HYPO|nr:hypothetical protein B0T10DRAFT_467349 [Thelonectria olida]